MTLSDILTSGRTEYGAEISSKKRALERISALIAQDEPSLSPDRVFDCLFARERLGSTGLGKGVALPHGRIKGTSHTLGAFVTLREGVDFDAIDHQPVDLVFGLLVPEDCTEEHLQILAELAEMFSDQEFREQLRRSSDSSGAFGLIKERAGGTVHEPET